MLFYGSVISKMEKQLFTLWLALSSQILLTDAVIHQNAIEIYSLHIDCKVMSRYAHTVITSRIVNRANESKEALFDVELPKKAFITNFSMTIDGETYPGIIREKKAAQAQYDSAISRGQSAGLVKSTGRKLEKFSVSVNVAAAGKVNFELNYEQLLDRKLGNYELIIKVKPKQLVKDFQIDTHIFEPQGISFLAIEGSFLNNEISDALVKTQEETKAHILFKPTLSQQRKNPESEQTLLDGDFIIRYDVKRNVDVGDIQIVNGYFVHYFAPSDMPVFPKNIIFVIDKSGSMSGNKIRQTKEALEKILEDLNPKDHFNLIVFSRGTSKWKPTLVQASKENVESAKQYVKTIDAQGGTNINEALLTAIDSLDKATYGELLPERSISTIILLTDGQPTSGETNPKKIQKNINNANEEKYFLYCLGFGFDVSYSFLEKLALDNSGVARRIYEDSDAALQLQDFYSEVAIPILKEININYLGNAVEDVTENNFKLLYEGSEIVVAGKLDNEIDIFSLEIKAQGHGSNLTLKEDANVTEKAQVFEHQEYIFGNFIEKLWAYLTIQQLLEKSILAEKAEQKTLENQALNLSLKYSFVTPMTSMVVTKPEAEEVANKPTEEDNEDFQGNFRGHAGSSYALPHSFPGPPRLIDTSIQYDYVDVALTRSAANPGRPISKPTGIFLTKETQKSRKPNKVHFNTKSGTHDLPTTSYHHFLFQPHNKNFLVCISINGQPQTPLNLLSDPEKGIEVTGKLGENNHFTEFEITYPKLNLEIKVSTEKITLKSNDSSHSFVWTDRESLTNEGLNITLTSGESLFLSGPDNIVTKIFYVPPPLGWLGLYFENSDSFSNQVTGLFGQFFSNTNFQRSSGQVKLLYVHGQPNVAIRTREKDYRTGSSQTEVTCWKLNINT
ncbi:inter-alpha-trypsin inhibitor heavy chain H4-like isoform X3 [Thamnophis elegans]|uniref:inter-alpha-trypsin inhibitor heavy chain H4-like isoform X3 n=1 Tax=Thamnophis elegans TaxID=35005 RepID=UPI001377FC2D|nr:inter-alpha-trypsin inhibitor heavy chain H4-like isoform X3 [Thamnophis elegans]